jgi:hypothetical protein
MRVLLRNIETGLFFQGPEQWTARPKLARDFEHGTDAIKFVYDSGLKDMELLLAFEDGHPDICLPLQRNP